MRAVPLLAAVAVAGCGSAAGAGTPGPLIGVADFRLAPAAVTVPAGQVVRWRNDGATLHSVKGAGFFSRALRPGQTWSRRFTRPGVYRYTCTLHPQAMRGAIVVR
jgi:plastocyanin